MAKCSGTVVIKKEKEENDKITVVEMECPETTCDSGKECKRKEESFQPKGSKLTFKYFYCVCKKQGDDKDDGETPEDCHMLLEVVIKDTFVIDAHVYCEGKCAKDAGECPKIPTPEITETKFKKILTYKCKCSKE